jgi:hypothetical protein
MKKIVLASVAATALIAGLGAAKAAEPGEEQYFHDRGNINAAQAQPWAGPGDNGWGYDQGYGSYNRGGLLGFAPFEAPGEYDYDD